MVQFLLLHRKEPGVGRELLVSVLCSKLGSNEDVANIFTTAISY